MKDQSQKMVEKGYKSKHGRRLKKPHDGFVRLHIDKIVKGGKKHTTASIDLKNYIFLSYKLKTVPLTREANRAIKDWIKLKMDIDPVYDKDAEYDFSLWLKNQILMEIVDPELLAEYWDDGYFTGEIEEDLGYFGNNKQ